MVDSGPDHFCRCVITPGAGLNETTMTWILFLNAIISGIGIGIGFCLTQIAFDAMRRRG